MKAKLVPVFFKNERTDRFSLQLNRLKSLLSEQADFLQEQPLGQTLPDCDAVVFPEILGEAYRSVESIQKIVQPILIITSEFATVSMWDWEISNFLKGKGVRTINPYSLEESKTVCKVLATKRKMSESRFLIFQDNPGEGFQPEIFKSFYWWEKESDDTIKNKFGTIIERRSLKALGKKAAAFSDGDAESVWKSWDYPREEGFAKIRGLNAARLYLAVKEELDRDDIIGVGSNCLNESHHCTTTPCLTWDRLLEEKGLLWACEGDTQSLASQYMLYNSIGAPLLMTNIYPFLMGNAALKHERIPSFPEIVDDPENHILLGHCGYFGLLPRSMSSDWILRAKALAIVNENSHMFDARMKTGDVTLTRMNMAMDKLLSVKGDLRGYVQYGEHSDVKNGGILRVPDGRNLMDNVYSHHVILMEGDHRQTLDLIGKIMDLEVEKL
ncbi:hypothetical protein [Oceanispirochaeta sp.]|jgi:hypothetical protein|uniref:hypothetical protein n=1 Tax=Oceanispirochaeta sp. TaxID=2035350 RepID=UPI00261F0353|nr:hypothetical protein [Oceanispirochaeta sp.]MDA3958741.1 hypothetical protein [Oceanispirochaeta sp.]